MNLSRQASCNMLDLAHSRTLDGSQPHMDQSWDHRQNTLTDLETSPSLYSHYVAASPHSHM